jgi:hypothetical protein
MEVLEKTFTVTLKVLRVIALLLKDIRSNLHGSLTKQRAFVE